MSAYPKVFDPLDVMVVESGETSGELAACLNHLSAWYTFRNRLKHIILQGMTLPVVVLHLVADNAAAERISRRHRRYRNI